MAPSWKVVVDRHCRCLKLARHHPARVIRAAGGGQLLNHPEGVMCRASSTAIFGHVSERCRFGTDPATSVLDVNCKAHEVDNLYVVDTSFFPSIGAVNPALTAMANAIRVGDHLLSRMS